MVKTVTLKNKLVPSVISNICPYCLYVHYPYEGTSEMDDSGRVDFACVKCGRTYHWLQYHIEPEEGHYINRLTYFKLLEELRAK